MQKIYTHLILTLSFFCGFLVLSNPETRSIYDVYGQKGLDAGWEVRLNGSETDIVSLEKRKTEIIKPILLSFQIIERRRTPAEVSKITLIYYTTAQEISAI